MEARTAEPSAGRPLRWSGRRRPPSCLSPSSLCSGGHLTSRCTSEPLRWRGNPSFRCGPQGLAMLPSQVTGTDSPGHGPHVALALSPDGALEAESQVTSEVRDGDSEGHRAWGCPPCPLPQPRGQEGMGPGVPPCPLPQPLHRWGVGARGPTLPLLQPLHRWGGRALSMELRKLCARQEWRKEAVAEAKLGFLPGPG